MEMTAQAGQVEFDMSPTRAYSVRPEDSVSNVASVIPHVLEMVEFHERRTTELLAELVSVKHELSSSVDAHNRRENAV